jgi:hypothetical protein
MVHTLGKLSWTLKSLLYLDSRSRIAEYVSMDDFCKNKKKPEGIS